MTEQDQVRGGEVPHALKKPDHENSLTLVRTAPTHERPTPITQSPPTTWGITFQCEIVEPTSKPCNLVISREMKYLLD